VAGLRGFELRNVAAKYPFEKTRRFPAIQPNLAKETIRARAAKPGHTADAAVKCHCVTSREDSNRSVSTIFGNSGRCRGHVRSSSSIRTLRQCSPNSRFVPIATERSAAKYVVIRSPRRPARAACPAPQGRAPWRSCPPATFRDGTAGCIFPPLPCTDEEL